jgi:hypothetical protein
MIIKKKDKNIIMNIGLGHKYIQKRSIDQHVKDKIKNIMMIIETNY